MVVAEMGSLLAFAAPLINYAGIMVDAKMERLPAGKQLKEVNDGIMVVAKMERLPAYASLRL